MYKVFQTVNIPIIGIGGITNSTDVLEYMLAGASAVQVGTANYRNPEIALSMIDELNSYVGQNKLSSITDMVGAVS